MSDLIPIVNDNVLLKRGRFSNIKEYLEPHHKNYHVVRDSNDKVMVVGREPRIDTHMQHGWYESWMYVNQFKYENSQ